MFMDQSNQITILQVLVSKANTKVDTVHSVNFFELKPDFECY